MRSTVSNQPSGLLLSPRVPTIRNVYRGPSLPYLVREYGATKYPKELLSLLKIIYFDALKLKIAKERNLTFPGSVSDNENVIKLAGQYRKGELLKAINVLSDGERQLYFNGSFAQILEISLSKILAGNRG